MSYPHDSSESFGGSGGYGIDDEVFGGHEDWRFETEMCLEGVDGEVACMEEGSGSALCEGSGSALCEGSGSALCEGESCSSQCEVDGLGERGWDELDTEQLVEEAMRCVTSNIGGEVQFELMPGEIEWWRSLRSCFQDH